MAGLSSSLYNLFFRKNTVMLGTVFASAFAIQMAFDSGSEKIWDGINKGRQWKDIKHRYVQAAEEE
ncbi:ubiquinol-cytochrome C reductase [Glonium stellatum]|uniref:Complex III subunit 9 n=1 Tax=Glonium stellatum TaxID=574774 RepID=A0A8E2JPE8_9PEZI|nr:ubiquinol-cytochrome C reductase [Glonium stellatum]